VLWASFHAFGEAPPWAVIVMAYFVGMLGNLLRCRAASAASTAA
jgi:hypothetical protein